MKAAVVGCGNISRMHFSALNELDDVEIVAVADIKKDRADEKSALYNAKAYYDIDDMLNNEQIDCLHICTPHYLHTQMAVKALGKGINVLVEKPCSVSNEEIKLLRKAQKESGKQVAVCFQNRYNLSIIALKKAVLSGEYGAVKSIRAFVTWNRGEDYYSDDWHGTLEKECGGVLINQAIHTIDLIQYIGGECKSITAHTFNDHLQGVIEVEDTATVLMQLGNGVKAVLYATLAYGENSDVFVEVCFENGIKLRLEGEKLFKIFTDGKTEELCEKSKNDFIGQSYWGHGHSSLIADYYDCLKTGRKFEIDAFEGGKAAEIVAECYEQNR